MKIFLSAGHGGGPGSNRGALIGNEGDNNYYYSLVLKEELEKYEGVTVGLAKTDVNQNPTLQERGNMSKGYDLMLSLHSNAFSNNAANGFVLFDSVEKPNKTLATNLQNNLSKHFRYNRGVQYKVHPTQSGRSYYGILRYSLAKSAMMLEHGFHTNPEDAKVYVYNRKELAKTTAETIAKHYNLKLKDGKTNNKDNEEKGINYSIGDTIEVRNAQLYASSTGNKPGKIVSGDFKITHLSNNKFPIHIAHLGWISESAIVRPQELDDPAPKGKIFRVVVGSFKNRNNAVAQQKLLKNAGFDSFLSLVDYKE